MRDSTLTSEMLKHRVKMVESERLGQMEQFIREKDFNRFARLVMQDSNNFHSICLDTFPPLFYLNDRSREIIRFVNEFNKFGKQANEDLKVAYRFVHFYYSDLF
jgi:diphosphomevalonate decarboxylase